MTTEERRAMILALAMSGSGGGGGGEGAARYALDALCLVDYGMQTGESTAEEGGLTITRKGNRLKVNGTATATVRVRMTGDLATRTSAPNAAANPAGVGAVLIAGHAYAVIGRLVSGTVTFDGNTAYPALYPEESGTAEIMTAVANGTSYHARTLLSGGSRDLLWITLASGSVFANAVYEYTLIDQTMPSDGLYIGITSATPTIAAIPGGRYVCTAAAVTELAFTPSASGICSVRFVSGTTPTVLTLPAGVKMPSWWNGCAASTTYEISIADGVYGAVGVWT